MPLPLPQFTAPGRVTATAQAMTPGVTQIAPPAQTLAVSPAVLRAVIGTARSSWAQHLAALPTVAQAVVAGPTLIGDPFDAMVINALAREQARQAKLAQDAQHIHQQRLTHAVTVLRGALTRFPVVMVARMTVLPWYHGDTYGAVALFRYLGEQYALANDGATRWTLVRCPAEFAEAQPDAMAALHTLQVPAQSFDLFDTDDPFSMALLALSQQP